MEDIEHRLDKCCFGVEAMNKVLRPKKKKGFVSNWYGVLVGCVAGRSKFCWALTCRIRYSDAMGRDNFVETLGRWTDWRKGPSVESMCRVISLVTGLIFSVPAGNLAGFIIESFGLNSQRQASSFPLLYNDCRCDLMDKLWLFPSCW